MAKQAREPVLSVSVEDIKIDAPNNWTLSATLFTNANSQPDAPVVLVSTAAGAPRGFYSNFAHYLVDAGAHSVMTYDYRGMGDSSSPRKRWNELRMKDWGLLDFPAAAQALQSMHPDRPLLGLGHSYGGQALGLSGISDQFERYATVATMSGYWRHLSTPKSVWFQTQIVGMSAVRLLGRVPGSFGLGETFPGTIFRDWSRWIADPDYFFKDAELPETSRFSEVTLPLLSIGLTDDPWANKRAIGSFMKHYTNADFHQVWVEPGDSGPIGHLGYFRQRHRESHWSIARDFLLKGTIPEHAATTV
ncbi:MAG: alpha/beta fold hydrolase [Pseudomonadota bacterium]